MKKFLALMCVCAILLQRSHAQDSLHTRAIYLHSGKIGLGLDGITGSPNLLLKYFFNNQLAMQVVVGGDIDIPGGSAPPGFTKVTGITARGGLGVLIHFTQDQVSPYAGIEAVFQYSNQGGIVQVVSDPDNSVFSNFVFGGEYFVSEKFTVGIKQGLGTAIQLKRDVPKRETSIKVNTSTLFTARFYFN